MDLIVKQASALTTEEKTTLGITGIPDSWPIESYPYVDVVPDGFTQMTDSDMQAIKDNNQAAYDAWLQSLRPIVNTPPENPVNADGAPIVDIGGIKGLGTNIVASNRIPPGYSICATGIADNIVNGTYGDGYHLMLSDVDVPGGSNHACLQFLDHWYAIGGRVFWEGGTLNDSANATLVAPATTGLAHTTGDYTKINLGGPYNMIKPVATTTGDWSMDLAAKLNVHVSILAATPVPIAGNTGWFDYNSDTNVMSRNMTQTGGYNLYDFDINLFALVRKSWGRPTACESHLEADDVIGKLIYNSWQLRFTLDVVTSGVKCGIMLTTARKRSI